MAYTKLSIRKGYELSSDKVNRVFGGGVGRCICSPTRLSVVYNLVCDEGGGCIPLCEKCIVKHGRNSKQDYIKRSRVMLLTTKKD